MDKEKETRRQRRAGVKTGAGRTASDRRQTDTGVKHSAGGKVSDRRRTGTGVQKSAGRTASNRRRSSHATAKTPLTPQQRDQRRRARQRAAAKRRKRQLIIRMILLLVAVAAVIAGIVLFSKAQKQKKLEPDGGAGTNALQAAEAATGTGQNNTSGQSGTDQTNPDDPTGENTSATNPNNTESANSQPQAATPEPAKDEDTLTLCMIGDVILHQRVLDASVRETGYDFSNLFANVANEIQKYDIKIVNQETILGGPALEYTGYPAFNSPYEEADALVNAGFNVVLQATNHTLDKGQPAVQNCLNYWNNAHPETAVLGIHDANEPSQDIYVFEKNGIRVAILNYTYGSNKYQEEIASGELAGEVNIMDAARIQSDVQRAREMADYVVVCPHWGVENELEFNSEQSNWCRQFLDWGVDLVLGTHPHVIQPVEMFTRPDGHQMLVYYSLGNFLSNQADRYGNVGGMAQVIIKRNEHGVVVPVDYGVRPVVCHEGYDGEAFTTYFLDEYSEEMAASNDVRATDPEFSYAYCQDLCNLIFSGLGKLEIE